MKKTLWPDIKFPPVNLYVVVKAYDFYKDKTKKVDYKTLYKQVTQSR